MSYYASIINKYEKILENKPSSINAVISLARLYLKSKEIDKSINFYEALIDPMPKNIEIFKSMGVLYLAKNDKREAIKYIKQALLLKKNDPALYEYAAEIDYIKSDQCYEIALDIYNFNKISEVEASHCFLIAVKLYEKGKYDLATKYIETIEEYFGNTVEYKNLLGSLHYKAEKYNEAIEEYISAINLLGYSHYMIAINIANCYEKIGDFEQGLKHLFLALEAGDKKEILYYHIALLYLKQKDKENAKINLDKSLQENSRYIPSKQLLTNL